jgi:septin 7
MKRLHDRVNIIPVIAKADTLTSEELRLFKKSIMQDIINEKIKLYEFPDVNNDENKLSKIYKDKVPFAVVGSNFVLERATKRARVRQYAWGTVDGKHLSPFILFKFSFLLVEDEAHSDFIALRNMIIKTNLNDLRDVTHNIHYETYRYKKLSSFNNNDSKNGKTFPTISLNKFVQKLFNRFILILHLLEVYYHKLKMKEWKQKHD